jgi:hypothetical protein
VAKESLLSEATMNKEKNATKQKAGENAAFNEAVTDLTALLWLNSSLQQESHGQKVQAQSKSLRCAE